jgi:hypothetical protein
MVRSFSFHFTSSAFYRTVTRSVAVLASLTALAQLSACSAPVVDRATSASTITEAIQTQSCTDAAATAARFGSLSSGFPISVMAYSAASAANQWIHVAGQCPTLFASSSLQAARADTTARTYARLTHEPVPVTMLGETHHEIAHIAATSSPAPNIALSAADAAVFARSFDRLAFSEEFLAAHSPALRSSYYPESLVHRDVAAHLTHVFVPESQCSQLSSQKLFTCAPDPRERLYSVAALTTARKTVADTMTGITAPLSSTLVMEAGLESARFAGRSSSDTSADREHAARWAASLMSTAFQTGYPFFTPSRA